MLFRSNDTSLLNLDTLTRNSVICASFLHDIGHLIGMQNNDPIMQDINTFNGASLGIVGHEGIGSAYLHDLGFPAIVCNLVFNHVASKRYLCTTKPGYINNLSDASKETMKLQGGLMTSSEITNFQNDSITSWQLKIKIREYDDMAKNKNCNTDWTDFFNHQLKPILESVLIS